MNAPILRALFLFKAPQSEANAAPSAGPLELMGALRARPRKASLDKARLALAPHFRLDPVGDCRRCAPWGLEVLHFELSPMEPGLDFSAACEIALSAMRLRPKGAGPCVALALPPEEPSGEQPTDFASMLAHYERRVASIYHGASSALERAQIESVAGLAGAPSSAKSL